MFWLGCLWIICAWAGNYLFDLWWYWEDTDNEGFAITATFLSLAVILGPVWLVIAIVLCLMEFQYVVKEKRKSK